MSKQFSLRPRLAFCGLMILLAMLSGCASTTYRYTTLKDAFAGKFLIGTANDLTDLTFVEQANIRANYDVVTPENCMKPGPIHPAEDTYNFGPPDALVKWCEDNNIQVVGHNLCWHQQTNDWFFKGADGGEVSREVLIERFKAHITTVVGRYKGRIKGWDVVNEAIEDKSDAQTAGTENLRASNWEKIIGPEYLTMAFKWAHEADPRAELYYNDYNIESGAKHASSMILLRRLIADGAPITAVGIQGHWNIYPKYADIEQAIKDYRSLGLKVMITELDIAARGTNSGAFTPGEQITDAPDRAAADAPRVTPTQRQVVAYGRLFEIFSRYPDTITRVTFWGINDRRSWRRTQQPLLFDGQMNPKPVFDAILQAASMRDDPLTCWH